MTENYNIEFCLFLLFFCLDLDPPDIQFNHQGYLFLASDEGTKIMEENHQIQT